MVWRDHFAADSGLDGYLEQVAGDQVFQLFVHADFEMRLKSEKYTIYALTNVRLPREWAL